MWGLHAPPQGPVVRDHDSSPVDGRRSPVVEHSDTSATSSGSVLHRRRRLPPSLTLSLRPSQPTVSPIRSTLFVAHPHRPTRRGAGRSSPAAMRAERTCRRGPRCRGPLVGSNVGPIPTRRGYVTLLTVCRQGGRVGSPSGDCPVCSLHERRALLRAATVQRRVLLATVSPITSPFIRSSAGPTRCRPSGWFRGCPERWPRDIIVWRLNAPPPDAPCPLAQQS